MLRRPRLGLQVSIVLIIAFVVACLTIATATSIYLASSRAAQEGAQRLFSEITARVADRVEVQINDLLDLAGLGASLPASVDPIGDATGHGAVPFLLRALEQSPNLYSVYIGQADGGFLQVIAVRDDDRILAANKAPAGTRFILRAIATGADGVRRETWTFLGEGLAARGSEVKDNPPYDPRQRPWYLAALDRPDSILSEPYVFSSLREPGLTASRRLANGAGVFGVDVTLRGLSGFVGSQVISPQGGIALIDQKRRILALAPALAAGVGREIEPLAKLAEIDDPLMRALSETVASDTARLVQTGRGEVLVQATDWHDRSGQAISIGIISPFADFTGPIKDMQRRILTVTALVLLLVVPLAMLLARNIARAVKHLVVEAERVRRFDFAGNPSSGSFVSEFQDLGEAFGLMKQTIAARSGELAAAQGRLERLVDLGIALSAERDSGRLMDMILMGAKELSNADGGTLYICDEDKLRFQIIRNDTLGIKMGGEGEPPPSLPPVAMTLADGTPNRSNVVSHSVHEQMTINIPDAYDEGRFDFSGTKAFDQRSGYHSTSFLTVPLKPRGGDVIGALQLINARPAGSDGIVAFSPQIQRFVEALAAQAATALYNRELLDAQERLMDAMIQIMAGAIDAKSPYTGGHCERVPELSLMLAEEACKVTEGPLAGFAFHTPEQWREFKIGAWLHDCGKVTTPEYVVDKATKLETIHNRIHEVRMRFEVLLRDARIGQLEAIAAGTPPEAAEAGFEARKAELAEEFAFVAECNLGGEFMAPERVARLKEIAGRGWMRHFDDRLGLSQDELRRMETMPAAPLPAAESLLADKPHHVIPRPANSAVFDPELRFKTKVPDNLYNFGEVYNLGIGRGTLTEEERFKINEHIIQTIIMLERMPFPKQLSRVAEYAGAHHETLTGTGYPRGLDHTDLSIPSRITAIADVFEALTASDRPYKKPKTLSECVKILSFFKKDKHIDPDLFDLFLSSGVYLRYAERFLKADQIDEVEIAKYLG
ncbi:MAG: HD domain-containing phosphohydrolase [Phaeospirillum sp.]|nr:HD domain-containing phosphohydrolase [Phaeospirillum sp.]